MRDNELVCAGFGARAAAYLIDRAIIFVGLGSVRLVSFLARLLTDGAAGGNFLFRFSFADVLCWLLGAAYLVALTYCTGSTLGKKLLHIRVVSDTGERPRFLDVLYRETIGRYLSGIALFGYWMAIFEPQKRAFHDWLCATRVVYDGRHMRPMTPASDEEAEALEA